MSTIAVCAAPPRRTQHGPDTWTTTCTRFGRLWSVSRGGQSVEVLRCDDHAAELRSRGYQVTLKQEAPKRERKKWDMTSTNSLEAGAEYLRKNSDGLVVLVIRSSDCVIALAPGLAQSDVLGLMQAGLPEAFGRLDAEFEAVDSE